MRRFYTVATVDVSGLCCSMYRSEVDVLGAHVGFGM